LIFNLIFSLQYFLIYPYPFLKLILTNFIRYSNLDLFSSILFFMKKLDIKSSGSTTSYDTHTIPQRLTVAGDA
jgi:lipid II:glycine glycyltransferase (peptidoglycan interpeptide bridge formation enzyme)